MYPHPLKYESSHPLICPKTQNNFSNLIFIP